MAAPMDLSKILHEHPILKPLWKYKDRLACVNECKDWIALRDGELFVWDANTATILTTNLKRAVCDGRETSFDSSSLVFQTLTLTSLPINDVEQLKFSPSGSYIALVSKQELIVVQLPQRWGKHGLYEGGKDRVLCKSTSVAEHLLVASGVGLVHAAWHPGSLDDSHLVLLTADNFIRTYDLQKPTSPVESVSVTPDEQESFHESTIRLHRALGDVAVCFDFGPVIEQERKAKIGGRAARVEKYWPVYVLCGSGDVYRILSKLDASRKPQKLQVQGPLSMFPPAEDNYGSDGCALLCLTGQPTVLVLATIDGRIYHAVILSSDTEPQKNKSTLDSLDETNVELPPTCALYVYETIQLELSLTSTPFMNEDSLDDTFTCLMRLQKDTSQSDRYMCVHSAGLHAVQLTWWNKLQEFTKTEDGTDLPKLSTDCQARVEHLICTKPLNTSVEAPPLGAGVITDKMLGTCLVILTVSLEFIVLPLRTVSNQFPPPTLLSDQDVKPITSPMKQLHSEPFDLHIQRILRRDSTHPIIKTTKKVDLSPQECFMLLSQAVQVMREEYIQKQVHAKHDIDRRIELLKDQKVVQEEDLLHCQQNKHILREKAGALAEKYEEAKDSQANLIDRLELILRKLYARLPMMSDAEKNMHRELKSMQDKLRQFKSNIQQLKIKEEYQQKQIASHHSKQQRQSSRSSLSKTQQQQLRTLLKTEGDEIAELVKQLTHMKTGVET